MIKVLLDTNIILDVALKRQRFYNDAANIFKLVSQGKIQVFVSASAITDIFYILRKDGGKEKALHFLSKLVQVIEIAAVDRSIIVNALELGWNDIEDALQECVAQKNRIDVVVTRNSKDFEKSKLKVFSSANFLEYISLNVQNSRKS